jgi:hypothetical protein
MTLPRTFLPALLAGLVPLLAFAAPAGAASKRSAKTRPPVTIGIADQKPDMFADPRFLATGIAYARIAVGWDAMGSRWQVAELDRWMRAAKAAGIHPLVSFMHSRTKRRSLPSPDRFVREFRRFRARYPWVRDYATWNEANHCGEPTCHRAALVAVYYRRLKLACRSCRILAAELLDMPNMVLWTRHFLRKNRSQPRYWGLHNYVDANRFQTSGTKRLLGAVKGKVWLTEVGGIVSRHNHSKIPFPESPAHAAKAVRWVFDRLVPLSSRVQRVYVYHWNTERRRASWDSALIGPRGRVRPALGVVERELTLQAARRAARARAVARTRR